MPLADEYPFYLGNEAHQTTSWLEVQDKYSLQSASRVARADAATIDRAIALAHAAEPQMARLPAFARKAVLLHCAEQFKESANELAEVCCIEAGKPIRDARVEVERLIDTFVMAAEESIRIGGEVLPLDVTPRAEGYWGAWKRMPIGTCSFITPFNFPLNLVAHKVAPAIAAGCPFVLKPSSLTPIGSLMIARTLAQTQLPKGAFSVLPCDSADAEALTVDARIKRLSFTGSDTVGWSLKSKAGKKKVTLELGGNAAAIIDRDTQLMDAVDRLAVGAFYQSGQSCISVQRILVHSDIYPQLRDALVAKTRQLPMGDPKDSATVIGPIISEKEAQRIDAWVKEAVSTGARLLCGGERKGTMMQPTLLENVSRTASLFCKEAFGPVAILSAFDDFEAALQEANDSAYGLQVGVFTNDLAKVKRAWDTLQVGGVLINDVPSWRVDHMPYGGVKDSGLGREGVRYAIEEMTEIRLLAVRTLPEGP